MDGEIELKFEGVDRPFTIYVQAPDDALARLLETHELVSVRVETSKWTPVTSVVREFNIAGQPK
jgi:hypothetical protein